MKLHIQTDNYFIQPLAPFQNFRLALLGKDERVPFIVNLRGFKTYPKGKSYTVTQDGTGSNWFAHDNTFTNVMEDNRVSFADKPVAALMDFIHYHEEEV